MLRLCYFLLFCFSSLYATLGTLNPNANITLSLQTQPSFSKDTILSNTESEKDLQTLGVNTNLSNTEQSTQEIQSRALRASLSIDNHLLSNGVEGEWIGFNTLSNDMTNPNAIINTLFHETSNKELHHKSKDDAYANNRGNSAESIFALKNYQGKNTNTISTLEWNQRETTREALIGGGVLREGNEYNRRAWIGQGSGSGERDNKINPIYRDNEDKKNYNQAIAYLKKSKEFQKIFKRLEDSEIIYTIIFNDQDINIFSPFEYNGIRSEIYWDALGGLRAKLGNQSPATGLAHEMGHAYHYDTGEIRTRSARQEEEITTKLKGIIAKQLGEAIRRNYDDHNGSFRAIHPTSTQERK